MAVLSISLLLGTASMAQSPAQRAPHGGALVKTEGGYYIEMLAAGDALHFYVFDKAMQALPTEGITGSVVLQFTDSTSTNAVLEAQPNGYYRMVVMNSSDFVAVANFKVKGSVQSAQFPSGPRTRRTGSHQHNPDGSHVH
ncbi:MAG: hypothetical protein IPJ76_01595 [Flavobacteriales bacterium]|nr:MAG: hypothetical protein IPJ76_01595 [Flavobacteriales bacterium]